MSISSGEGIRNPIMPTKSILNGIFQGAYSNCVAVQMFVLPESLNISDFDGLQRQKGSS